MFIYTFSSYSCSVRQNINIHHEKDKARPALLGILNNRKISTQEILQS